MAHSYSQLVLAAPGADWLYRGRRPTGDDERPAPRPTPILAQLEEPPPHSAPNGPDDPESERDYEAAEQMGWPRPAWGLLMLALAVACWVISPRGFLAGRFLSDVFLWAATACLLLGVIILVGRWFVGEPLIEDAVDDAR